MVILNERRINADDSGIEDLVGEEKPKADGVKPNEESLGKNVADMIDTEKTQLIYVTNYVIPDGVFEVIYTPRIEAKMKKSEKKENNLFDITKLHEQIYLWFEKKGVLRNLKVYMKSPYQKFRELLWYKDNPAGGFMDRRFRVYGKAR